MQVSRLRHEMARVEARHKELDVLVTELPGVLEAYSDQGKRWKKEKLLLKDRIAALERRLRRLEDKKNSSLGMGGCGQVFAATDDLGRDLYAAKVASGPLGVALLEREYELLRLAQRSPRVVRVRGFFRHPQASLIMDRLGPSLEHLLWVCHLGCNGFSQGTVCAVAHDLLLALRDLRGAGVVHGDVKPDNVLLGPNGLTLIDFGGASKAGHEYHPDAGITPAFAPRRRLEGTHHVARYADDLESLAFLLAYLLSGRDFVEREADVHQILQRQDTAAVFIGTVLTHARSCCLDDDDDPDYDVLLDQCPRPSSKDPLDWDRIGVQWDADGLRSSSATPTASFFPNN